MNAAPCRRRKGEKDGEHERADAEHGREEGREQVLVVPVDGVDNRPAERRSGDDCGGDGEPVRRCGGTLVKCTGDSQREERCPMEGEEQDDSDPGDDGVRR